MVQVNWIKRKARELWAWNLGCWLLWEGVEEARIEIRKHHLWWIIFKVLALVLGDEFVGACDMIKNKRNWGVIYEPRMNVYLELKEAVHRGIKTTQRILHELPHAEAESGLEEEPGRFCQVTIGFLSWKKKWYIEIKRMKLQNSETWDKKKREKLKIKVLFFPRRIIEH